MLAREIDAGGMNDERRTFLRKSFLGALGASAGLALAQAARAAPPSGDPAILEKQPWQTSLGHPVAAIGYGVPSKYEANLPGLAYDYYGDVEMWRVIMEVNGLSDPLNDVVVGAVLAMPTRASVDAFLASAKTVTSGSNTRVI